MDPSRRAFMKILLEGGFKTASLPLAFRVLLEACEARGAGSDSRLEEVLFYEKLANGIVRCLVCPNQCTLEDGATGRCRARANRGGTHYSLAYGIPCILSPAPIEKLPMNQFLPGSDTVCIAAGGCNLRCLYCQNYAWSQKGPRAIKKRLDLSPAQAVHAVLKRDIRTIAFTYTDPIAYLEYALDIADIAGRYGVRCVAATNGFMNPPTARRAAEKFSGITVGLKGFDESFYQKVCGASLKPVLASIEEIRSFGKCWLELTTLIVPTYNDDLKKIKAMARWIRKNLGTDVPWHLARFIPHYKLTDVPRTPVQTLDAAMKIGLDEGLQYVYTSNIAPHAGNNTRCPRCGRTVIERIGFRVIQNHLKSERCRCGERLAGVF